MTKVATKYVLETARELCQVVASRGHCPDHDCYHAYDLVVVAGEFGLGDVGLTTTETGRKELAQDQAALELAGDAIFAAALRRGFKGLSVLEHADTPLVEAEAEAALQCGELPSGWVLQPEPVLN